MAKENMSFIVCCANGAGSSLMMKMTMQKMLDTVGIKPGKVHHCALSEGKTAASQYDVVFCAQNFANMFKDAEKKGTVVTEAGSGRSGGSHAPWTKCKFLWKEPG